MHACYKHSCIPVQDSLQGDLDLEYQSRLLASFSRSGSGEGGGFVGAGAFRSEEEPLSSSAGGGVGNKGQPVAPPPPPPPPPRLPRVFPFMKQLGMKYKKGRGGFKTPTHLM